MPAKRYSTSDIHIAAALMGLDFPLSETTRTQENLGRRPRAVFHFADSEDVRRAVMDYTNDELRVNPRILFGRLRELKSLVHNIFSG